MTKALFLTLTLTTGISFTFAQQENSSTKNIDDIKVKCDCEEQKESCQKEQLNPELVKILFEDKRFGALGETRTLTSQ